METKIWKILDSFIELQFSHFKIHSLLTQWFFKINVQSFATIVSQSNL